MARRALEPIAVILVILLLALSASADGPKAAVVHLDRQIDPLTEHLVYRQLERAREMGVDTIIVQIDSPGGEVIASFGIAETLNGLDWARTVAYIPREALSGASFVALGCDEIIMGPDARIGDCGPIYMGEDNLFRHAEEKVVTDIATRVRILSEKHGRPPALAEAMVDRNAEVYIYRHKELGTLRYLTEVEAANLPNAAVWQKGQRLLESRSGRFLELTGKRAEELGLAEAVVSNPKQLYEHLQLRSSPIDLKPTFSDKLVFFLNLPVITILVVVVGLVCLYVELSMAGFGIAGIISALCFMLFFWSRFLGGTADWLEVMLFVTGLALIAIELFVFPGTVVAGLTGVLLVFTALLFASQSFIIPRSTGDLIHLSQGVLMVGSSLIVAGVAMGFIAKYLHTFPVIGHLVLQPPTREEPEHTLLSDLEPANWSEVPSPALVGAEGVTLTSLRPAGKMRIGDRTVDVIGEGVMIDEGVAVRVIRVQGPSVIVRPIEGTSV